MAPAAQGRDWVEMLDARNNQRRGTHFSNSVDDPRFLLSVITDENRMFRDKLSRAEQSFASELRDTGNKLAHGAAFSADDTYRALDTMERLLTAADATAEADAVRKLRRDAQAAVFNSETRRAVQVVTGVEGHGLKPWREVITPHQDVRDGKMRSSEFAADLYYVARGEGSREYVNPVEFFRRTYLTEGLRDLLNSTARRISGDRNASPVWNLQTNFGGGKTHSMLALYHLLSGTSIAEYPDDVREVLGAGSRCRRHAGLCWSATTSRPARARTRRTGRTSTRCGASWPGSSAWPRAARQRHSGPMTWSGRRRAPVQPGGRARHADRRVRAVPDPDRRVGRLRAAACTGAMTWRAGRSTRSSRSRSADGGGQGGARGAACRVHPRVVR